MRAVLFALMVAGAVGAGGCANGSHVTSATTPAPLSTTLVLDSGTVRDGGVLFGRVEVRNDTGHPIAAHGCGGIFQVLLTSRTYHPAAIFPTCVQTITIPGGVSADAVTVSARYNTCGGNSGPPCSADGPAPLPPGEYEATTFESGNVVPVPKPVPVRVTS